MNWWPWLAFVFGIMIIGSQYPMVAGFILLLVGLAIIIFNYLDVKKSSE